MKCGADHNENRLQNLQPQVERRLSRILAVLLLLAIPWLSSGYEWQEGKGYRFAELLVPSAGKTGFQLLSPDATGVPFTNA